MAKAKNTPSAPATCFHCNQESCNCQTCEYCDALIPENHIGDCECEMATHPADFDDWYECLNQFCGKMFLNTWESLGYEEKDARFYFDHGDRPIEVCRFIMNKYPAVARGTRSHHR